MPPSSAVTQALDRILEQTRTAARPLDTATGRLVVFTDHHKGQRDGADDFARCEAAYLAALEHYDAAGYTLIVLGDAEELWENRVEPVLSAYGNVLAAERRFHPERLVKVWGNHDDEWQTPRRVAKHLAPVFGPIEVREALQLHAIRGGRSLGTLLLLHGHQGTLFSDRLRGIGKVVVRFVWRTIQRITRQPSTTPATDACLRDEHDHAMYRWAGTKPGLVLVAGHTHRPVFSSKTHLQQLLEEIERLRSERGTNTSEPERARRLADLERTAEEVRRKNEACEEAGPRDEDRSRPCYFNAGCCCFADGDVTGLEIADGEIRLVRWGAENGRLGRRLLAYADLDHVFAALANGVPSTTPPGEDPGSRAARAE